MRIIDRISKKLDNYNKKLFLKRNKKSKIKECYICKEKFEKFFPYRIIDKDLLSDHMDMVGSDINNYGCYYCNCNDRERHLFMYLDKYELWTHFIGSTILHVAPESKISQRINSMETSNYIKGDYFPHNDQVKLDITNLNYSNESFNIVICNHVLEHVNDMEKGLEEIHRVLKKGGFAILQVPYSNLLTKNFEESNIVTDEQRLYFYGEVNHLRVISKKQYFDDLANYFLLDVKKHDDSFDYNDAFYFGVNKLEDLILVRKK
jgi:SAM-dependent methyltransferase